mgnify:CR=1 FL=1
MRIGICDDDPQDCLALKNILSELRREDEVDCFTDSSDLLDAIREGREFYCLFLDILMPGVNGIELIPQIEDAMRGKPVHVVFVTSSRDYAVEAFAYRAAHYLVKPIRSEDVAEALSRIPSQPNRKPGITLKTGTTRHFLYLEEIVACESSDHAIQIRLNTGESVYASRMTMDSLQRQLGEEFVRLSRGLIVNMNYIETMDTKSCRLQDGRRILLSRRNLKQIHDAYDNFTFSRLIERGRD